jgi:hypothetical protein
VYNLTVFAKITPVAIANTSQTRRMVLPPKSDACHNMNYAAVAVTPTLAAHVGASDSKAFSISGSINKIAAVVVKARKMNSFVRLLTLQPPR